MTSDVTHEVPGLGDLPDGREERLARRIADLYADDPQFRAAQPDAAVIAAARRPGLRLAQILQTLADGYQGSARAGRAGPRVRG